MAKGHDPLRTAWVFPRFPRTGRASVFARATLDGNTALSSSMTAFFFPLPSIAGAASITEAGDTLSATGVLPIIGTLGADEADPGTLLFENGNRVRKENNGQLKKERRSARPGDDFLTATATIAEAASRTGSLEATEGADTLSASATLALVAALSATEADDDVSGVASLPVLATLDAEEDADAVSADGVLPLVGSLDATEADDTVFAAGSADGTAPILASAEIAEADDTLAATARGVEEKQPGRGRRRLRRPLAVVQPKAPAPAPVETLVDVDAETDLEALRLRAANDAALVFAFVAGGKW